MRKKQYIRVKPYPPRKTKKQTQQEKEKRLYDLAEKLNVKIGGKT